MLHQIKKSFWILFVQQDIQSLQQKTPIVEKSIYVVFSESNDKSPRKEDVLDENTEILTNKMDNLMLKKDPLQNEEEDLKKDDEKEKKIKEPTPSQKDELSKEWSMHMDTQKT